MTASAWVCFRSVYIYYIISTTICTYKLYVEVRTPKFLTIECPLIPSCDIQKKRRVTWWSETTTPEVLGLLGAGGGWKTQRVVRCFVWLDFKPGSPRIPIKIQVTMNQEAWTECSEKSTSEKVRGLCVLLLPLDPGTLLATQRRESLNNGVLMMESTEIWSWYFLYRPEV